MATLQEIRTAYRWDATAQRWRTRRGAFVAEKTIVAGLRRFAANAGRSLSRLTARMYAGDVTLADWQQQAAELVKGVHLSQQAAAVGGFDRMTQADYGRAGSRLKFHYARLQDFADKIERGDITEAQAVARSAYYGRAGNITFQNTRLEQARTRFREGRRVLGVGEHCRGCLAEAAKGWIPVGSVKPLGLEICRMSCLCRHVFR